MKLKKDIANGINTIEERRKITRTSVDKVKAATNKVVTNMLTSDNANIELDKIMHEILASLGC
ncbi:integrase [Orientia tsutsugamushi]|uniref:integrase n=1 Tax=Orientia tsutsugamushi TaxID=784 RepID=UPI0035275278